MNPQKTQMIRLDLQQQHEKLIMVDIELMSESLSPLSTVRELGITNESTNRG